MTYYPINYRYLNEKELQKFKSFQKKIKIKITMRTAH